MYGTIYDYIRQQEVAYQKPIELEPGWEWSMKEHLRRSFLYKNSQFEQENGNRDLRPNKNIVLGILNVEYRTEGFDVKDIDIYVDNADEYYKSFLAKKFHNRWALEKQIDTFIDEVVESYCDYGGTLIRNSGQAKPEVVDLRTLAFCNQTDILSYPFAIKHCLSASQLREYDKWGTPENGATIDIESLITLCRKDEKDEIEIYELHGNMPIEWLKDNSDGQESKKDVQQIQVVAFYKKEDGDEQGVTLFKKKEPKLPFKMLKRDDIKGRALGRGGIEELFESQVWTNWNEVKVTEMLNAASKMIPWTNDPTLSAKHPSGLKDMDNLEFIEVGEGKQIGIVDTYPRNLAVFNDSTMRWFDHAGRLASTSELMGEAPTSGTPFKLYEAQNIEGKGIHNYRRGKIATFIEEVYRDWVLPYIEREIASDHQFLTELSGDEMLSISDTLVENAVNNNVKEAVLSGQLIEKEELESFKSSVKEKFFKSNKKFISIIADDFKNTKLSLFTNIAGKQKNLALLTDKLVNVMRQFISTPQIRQDPEMVKLLNVILESSGMSPIMFGSGQPQIQAPQGQGTQALQALSQANQPV